MPKRTSQREHLWIVISKPDALGIAVCVNMTTTQLYSDTTVKLTATDHMRLLSTRP